MWRDFWPSIRRVGGGGWLIVGILLVGLAAGIAGAWSIWSSMAGIRISTHGMIALGLGAVFTVLLGGGLMALVFYSARHGHDRTDDYRTDGHPGGDMPHRQDAPPTPPVGQDPTHRGWRDRTADRSQRDRRP